MFQLRSSAAVSYTHLDVYKRQILYSSDFGNTWNSLIHPPPFSRDDPYRITCFQNGFFAREDELIYFTDNLGMTWKNTSISAEYCNNINGLEVFNGIPYVTACGSGELLKRNSNSHWVLSNTGPVSYTHLDVYKRQAPG